MEGTGIMGSVNLMGMTFEQALHQIKIGFPCSRTGWNGKGLWVTAQFPDANSANSKPYLVMHSGDGDRVPWTPSQLDFFNDDWFVQAFNNTGN